MFNNGLKKEALSNLKKEKSIYDAQLSTTIITLEGFHNKKLEIKDKVKRFYDDVERIGGKPDFIKIELQKIDTELNKFDSALKRLESEVDSQKFGTLAGAGVAAGASIAAFGPSAAMAIATTFGTASTGTAIATLSGMAGGSALMAATGPVGWAVGGAALAISGFMANSKNKEIARKATEQIEKLKEETKKIKELTTKVNFERIELGKNYSTFSAIVDRLKLRGIKHWSELSEDEMKYIGTAINLATTIAKMLNKKVV